MNSLAVDTRLTTRASLLLTVQALLVLFMALPLPAQRPPGPPRGERRPPQHRHPGGEERSRFHHESVRMAHEIMGQRAGRELLRNFDRMALEVSKRSELKKLKALSKTEGAQRVAAVMDAWEGMEDAEDEAFLDRLADKGKPIYCVRFLAKKSVDKSEI